MPRAVFRAADFARHRVTIDEIDSRSSEGEPLWPIGEPLRDRLAILLEANGFDPEREVFALRVARENTVELVQEAGPSDGRRDDGRHLLVVDDDEPTCVIFAELLREKGFVVTAVGSAEEALRACSLRRPDLMIVDLWLPQMDGAELLERLRALDGLAPLVPAIVLTAVATDEAREASYAAGCQRFMTKPAFPEELLAAVEELIGSAVGSASSSEIRASRSTRTRMRSSGTDLR